MKIFRSMPSKAASVPPLGSSPGGTLKFCACYDPALCPPAGVYLRSGTFVGTPQLSAYPLMAASRVHVRARLVAWFHTCALPHYTPRSPFRGGVLTSRLAPHHAHIDDAYVPLSHICHSLAAIDYVIVADKHHCGLALRVANDIRTNHRVALGLNYPRPTYPTRD